MRYVGEWDLGASLEGYSANMGGRIPWRSFFENIGPHRNITCGAIPFIRGMVTGKVLDMAPLLRHLVPNFP